ncbi:Lrp/AsnC family transcriptional regulator [Actinophytocola oryzae]|uniref:DNA-binding Lrp family transcriptional regulator n=1 Tax=Actinophytocola oryzae TaxID=502181 RepID=A0A4V3FQI8_9PSEU|nr:Lrp/AsnC family transcriptional regulator [Actinophytocola oryzae]TDV39801.1 DNA-binding Lrp family transcriptional regulator [Actinophytocola oryzae]
MESVDDVDRGLIHALHLDVRAPFSVIADVLGVSENTVARRYKRLRQAGVLRVVGSVNGFLLGRMSWTIRVRCTPDVAAPIASALARRPDTFWVHILSGGTEISCNLQAADTATRDTLLMDKLPRSTRVLDVTAHAILGGAATEWAGIRHLTRAQARRLAPEPPTNEPLRLDAEDHAVLAALAKDGRTPYTALGPSESAARRRVARLRRAGVLVLDLDVRPEALGHHAEARLWLTVRPAALKATADTVAAHPETSFAAVTTGRTNLVATVVCRDAGDLYRYLTERVGGLDDVHTVETAPLMRTVKRSGLEPVPHAGLGQQVPGV